MRWPGARDSSGLPHRHGPECLAHLNVRLQMHCERRVVVEPHRDRQNRLARAGAACRACSSAGDEVSGGLHVWVRLEIEESLGSKPDASTGGRASFALRCENDGVTGPPALSVLPRICAEPLRSLRDDESERSRKLYLLMGSRSCQELPFFRA
jgi:hypothetical protein